MNVFSVKPKSPMDALRMGKVFETRFFLNEGGPLKGVVASMGWIA